MLSSRFVANALLFIGLSLFGMSISVNRPLWNDELYSQKASVQDLSYGQIIAGKGPEGNNSPLYYSIQKTLCRIFFYELDPSITTEVGLYYDLRSQAVLRIVSVISFSAAMTIVFDFFSRSFSFIWGLYSLAVFLSSFMVWPYWSEARPYPLWTLLGVLQLVTLLKMIPNGFNTPGLLQRLAITHLALALTAVLSGVQIVAVALVAWLYGLRQRWFYVWGVVAPWIIIVFYYLRSPKFSFFFAEAPWHLIFASIPRDRLILIGIFGLLFLIVAKRTAWAKIFDPLKVEVSAVVYLMVLLAAASAILVVLKLQENTLDAFQVSNRYFFFLFPSGVIATVASSCGLVKLCGRSLKLKAIAVLFLLFFLYFRFQKTMPFISHYLY